MLLSASKVHRLGCITETHHLGLLLAPPNEGAGGLVPVAGVALIDGVDLALLGNADVGMRQDELAQRGIQCEPCSKSAQHMMTTLEEADHAGHP